METGREGQQTKVGLFTRKLEWNDSRKRWGYLHGSRKRMTAEKSGVEKGGTWPLITGLSMGVPLLTRANPQDNPTWRIYWLHVHRISLMMVYVSIKFRHTEQANLSSMVTF